MKEENQAIIKALNMYGRVPEQWELLNEIERLKDDNKYLNKVNIELSSEKNILKSIIKEVRELLSKYNDNEGNYYVPVNIALEILDKEKG